MTLRPTDRIDLHVHTDASDGRDPPSVIANAPVAVLSICDHDTIRAYDRLPDAPRARILPGVEVSARLGDGEVHILGYFPGGFPDDFRDWIGGCEEDRRRRVRAGVSALRNDGIPLKWADYEAEVGDAVPCRTHVARCLVRIGWPRNPERLYTGFLNRNRFRGPDLPTGEAIAAIRDAGGLAVWAHPPLDLIGREGRRLVEEGLQGLEVHSPVMRGDRLRAALDFTAEHNLLRSGGTDFHGGRKKRVGWYRVTVGDVSAELLPTADVRTRSE